MSEIRPATHQPDYARVAGAASSSEKTALASFVLVVFYAIVRSLFAASARPFWYDEVITEIMARMRSLSALWRALALPADGCPPAFYLIERFASFLSKDEHVAYRLPSILGFAVTMLCLFVFIRKRDGNEIAAICAGGSLMTVLYGMYAIDARPYSLMVACVAVALVCYQHAPDWRWLAAMGFALALAEMVHYYSVFALIPFGVAEGTLFLQTWRIRWGVWLALAAGIVPLAAFWPLLNAMKATFGAHYWARPDLAVIFRAVVKVWDVPSILQLLISGMLLYQFILFLPLLGHELSRFVRSRKRVPEAPWTHERLLALSFLALPFIMFVVVSLMRGGLAERYMILAALGFLLAGACCLSRMKRKVVRAVSFSMLCVLVAHEGLFWSKLSEPVGFGTPLADLNRLVNSAGHSSLPVVVSDGVIYLPIAHYAGPESMKRFVFLTDKPRELAYSGTDSISEELIFLNRYVPLEIHDYREFARRHTQFLLYSNGDGQFDWWPSRFQKEGHLMQLLARDGFNRIYLVDVSQPIVESRCGSGC